MGLFSSYAKKIARRESPQQFDVRELSALRLNMLVHEDAIFSGFQLNNNYGSISYQTLRNSPQRYNYNELYIDANE